MHYLINFHNDNDEMDVSPILQMTVADLEWLMFKWTCLVSKCVQPFTTPWTAACKVSLSLTISWCLLKFLSIQSVLPSHPLFSSSSSAFNLSQHQGLFQWVSCLHQVAEVLELQLQHQSLQRVFRVDLLSDGLACSPCFPRESQEPSQAPQFGSINSSALCLLYCPALTSVHGYQLTYLRPFSYTKKAQFFWF